MQIVPRPLSERERETLGLLQSDAFDGVEALRQQALAAQVVGRCDCGCPTIDLATDPNTPSADISANLVPVEAGISTEDGTAAGEVIIFLADGRLSSMEYVNYGSVPAAWPDRKDLELHRVRT